MSAESPSPNTSHKGDVMVSYFMTGDSITQADRDHVAQAMAFFSTRGKRHRCLSKAEVLAALQNDILGTSTNRNAHNPIAVLFKSSKQINAMYHFLQQTRGDFHGIVVYISVDDSPFFAVM